MQRASSVHRDYGLATMMVLLLLLVVTSLGRAAAAAAAAAGAVDIWITRPSNDDVLLVGGVTVVFETRGFVPSVDTPIEVLLPQNGNVPALVEHGNSISFFSQTAYTQLVTLSATVKGKRVSTSVTFSTIPDEAAVLSMRVPLPLNARWGEPPPPNTPTARLRDNGSNNYLGNTISVKDHAVVLRVLGIDDRQDNTNLHPNKETTSDTGMTARGGAGFWREDEGGWRQGRRADGVLGTDLQEVLPPPPPPPPPQQRQRPLSLVFVGSLAFDGQKYIWMQQMEELSRLKFAPKYLMFHHDGGGGGGGDAGKGGGGAGGAGGAREEHEECEGDGVEEETRTWERATSETMMDKRLREACVPVVKVLTPQIDAAAVRDTMQRYHHHHHGDDDDSGGAQGLPDDTLEERIWKAVLDSIDRAGGDPGLMSPPWTREVFERIGRSVKLASPDILVVANGRTLGDAVLTRAARWAMGNRGHIIMEFPNLEPAPGVTVDVLATPSHYVARHPTLQAAVVATGAHVVVIPPGVKLDDPSPSNSVDLTSRVGVDESYAEGALCHPACSSGSRGTTTATTGRCDPACRVLGFAGRLSPEKSPGLFLMVAKHLAEMVPSAYFVIVGDGVLRPALEDMADRLGIASRVHFTGWASGTDLRRLLRGVDLLFNPSLAPSETFSIVNIESMAVATPVAAFGIGGMLEYLVPGVNSVVLDDPEPRAAAHEIAKVLLDPRRLAELGEKGREDVRRNFRADTALKRWAELYEALGRA